MDPSLRGPDWMQISPVAGFLFHEKTHIALAAEVRGLNEFLSGFKIEGGTHRGYRRGFNEGDLPGFDWNKGGRLYGGNGSYQYTKPEKRLRMTIDGSPLVEIDVSASYLTMLYGLLGESSFDPPTRDPYDVDGVERSVAKAWMTATFGGKGHLRKWPDRTVEDFKKSDGRNLLDVMPLKDVRSAMVARHPVLRDWGTQEINWADLMFHESQAIIGAMVELMGRGIPSLVVHDSLMVREEDREAAFETLGRRYHAVSGIYPRMKVSRPAAH